MIAHTARSTEYGALVSDRGIDPTGLTGSVPSLHAQSVALMKAGTNNFSLCRDGGGVLKLPLGPSF